MHQIQRYFRKAGKAVLRFLGRVAHGSVLDIAILACGVGLVGVGTTIAVVSSQKPPQLPVDVSSAAPMSVSSPVSVPPVEQEIYDPNENALDLAEYDGTLLAESTDGGEAYLNETIFLGDSNTYRLATYGLTSWQNNLSAVGMGIQHVTSTPSMYFKGMDNPVYMARAVAMMQPRRIVITYGTNNTDSSVETFKNQYRSALEAIKKEWPYADIIINAIPPVAVFRSNAANTQKNIDAFNKALAELAKEDGYQFLNSSEVLKDPTTGFARTDYMIGDGLHLNEDGAKALMGYVRTHTHIVADTRPALTELPVHQPTPEELFNPQAASSSSSSSSDSKGGITVNFLVRGAKDGGKLAGTLMQLASPGKTCEPVTATANPGYTMSWGCDAGGIYEGQGITTSGNQSTVIYTVPSNVTEKTLNVWVTFSKHEHTYDVWKDQNNGSHARYCSDTNCPDEQKGVETETHNSEREVSAAGTTYAEKYETIYVCGKCGAFMRTGNDKKPASSNTPSSNTTSSSNTMPTASHHCQPSGTWVNVGTEHVQYCANTDKHCPTPEKVLLREGHSYNYSGGGTVDSCVTGTCVCGAKDSKEHDMRTNSDGLKTCANCGYKIEHTTHFWINGECFECHIQCSPHDWDGYIDGQRECSICSSVEFCTHANGYDDNGVCRTEGCNATDPNYTPPEVEE